MKLRTLRDPVMVKAPILESPGFAKKGLSDYHLDLARRCAAGCSYCSSNAGRSMQTNKPRLRALAREQLGENVDPTLAPDVAITWDADEVMRRLEAQVVLRRKSWGTGKTLIVSQLTDAFLGYPLASGLTRQALDAVLAFTSFRIRILTKSDLVGRPQWVDYFRAHPGRFVVGLSVGTLDDAWASKVEPGTSKPSARLRALRRLQDAGVPTFGMACPVFPDMLRSDGAADIDALIDAIRPERCETVWAEPFNDRNNWRAVQAGYEAGTVGWQWLEDVYGGDRASGRMLWSRYATALYERLLHRARENGWSSKLSYLLYEDQITEADAPTFEQFQGVLLQSKPIEKARPGAPHEPMAGYSPNPHIARMQKSPSDGRIDQAMTAEMALRDSQTTFPVTAPEGLAE